jgi:hypothetical protein
VKPLAFWAGASSKKRIPISKPRLQILKSWFGIWIFIHLDFACLPWLPQAGVGKDFDI